MLITLHLFAGERFQTFNVYQVLHLKETVVNLGQLWSNKFLVFYTRILTVTCGDISREVELFKDRSANFVFFQVEIFKLHMHVFYNLIFKFNLEI